MLEQWKKLLHQPSGNLTTNFPMPDRLADKLLEEDEALKNKIQFEEAKFTPLSGSLADLNGLEILAGLQSKQKQGYLTLFRAMRVPTYKRIHDILYVHGYAFSNYEQERILDFYHEEDYLKKREEIKTDQRFWIQPQERVVHGLPVFTLVNDALQIHRAYRGKEDKVVIVVIHIPSELLKSGQIKLTANAAIDLDYNNEERDFNIADFVEKDSGYYIDYSSLRARGIDLHEMYSKDLPLDINLAKKIGIEQEFYLLDIYKVDPNTINTLFKIIDSTLLKENEYFLHGFFGDQNIFSRRRTEYLPSNCYSILTK